jgi:hypothetical protein
MYRFRILLLTQTILQEKKKNSRMKKLRVDPGSRIKKCTYFFIFTLIKNPLEILYSRGLVKKWMRLVVIFVGTV